MTIQVSSDGQAKNTRVVLVEDSGRRLDITTMVRGLTWHLDDRSAEAQVLLQCEGTLMSAELRGLLCLATETELTMDEARESMLEMPG